MRKYVLVMLALFAISLALSGGLRADTVVLFDEDAASEAGGGDFAALFGSHDAGSTVTVTSDDACVGDFSVFVTPSQSYNNQMAGWNFPIKENPGAGEYRYIAFAWKSDGGKGVMIQFPDDGAWGAVILLLGLVLVTSSDRLRGAPMLGVACAGLLISRLGAEVGQARWQQHQD